jgi:hypothetical protein
MAKVKPPFAPKGEYAPGAEVIWTEHPSGQIRTGQVWAPAHAEGAHPAFWVVPHEPYAREYAVRVVKVRKGGRFQPNGRFTYGPTFGEGEAVGVKSVFTYAEPAAVAA